MDGCAVGGGPLAVGDAVRVRGSKFDVTVSLLLTAHAGTSANRATTLTNIPFVPG
jgi:hypothetical protein